MNDGETRTTSTAPDTASARKSLQAVVEMLRPVMSEADFKAATMYMEEGELTVTFEHLCEQLYANNTSISQGIYKSLEHIGHLLGYADDSHWTELKPQVKI